MGDEVSVVHEDKEDVRVIRVSGRLDAVNAGAAETSVLELLDPGHRKVLMDLSGVTYLSSAGMRMLLVTSKKLKTMEGRFVVCCVDDNVMDVLKMSGFDHVLDIQQDQTSALEKLRS